MISRIRMEKNIVKAELARRTNINVGHISHIEKEERNPSHRALKAICRALGIPYQPLMYTYDKIITQEQRNNKIVHDTHLKTKGTPIKNDKKIGRNDPCPCGSGKKYKNCCGKTA